MDHGPSDAELFQFVLDQMHPDSPHMDGTFFWMLPLRVTRKRARTAREALVLAYQQHQRWVQEAKEKSHAE